MKKKLTLEQRIARLEKVLNSKKAVKNEGNISSSEELIKGAIVEDVNGDTCVIIDTGSFGDIYDKWFDRVDPNNHDEVSDYLIEFEDDDYNTPDYIWDAYAVVVKYDNGMKCIVVDPEDSLEVIGGTNDNGDELLYSRRMRRESRKINRR